MWRHILQVFQQSSFIVQVQDWPVCSPDSPLQMCGTLGRTTETSDCWSTKVIYQSTTFNNNIHYLWETGLFLIFFLKRSVLRCSECSLPIFTRVLARLRAAGSSVSRTICQRFEATDRVYGTSQNTASVIAVCRPHASKAKHILRLLKRQRAEASSPHMLFQKEQSPGCVMYRMALPISQKSRHLQPDLP